MKLAGKILLGLLLLVALAAAGLYAHLHESLPKLEGEVAVKGLGGSVEVLRDAEGVPHIYAGNDRDAWFAMGYVHAQHLTNFCLP